MARAAVERGASWAVTSWLPDENVALLVDGLNLQLLTLSQGAHFSYSCQLLSPLLYRNGYLLFNISKSSCLFK